jgi:hypothetical protein
MFKVGDEVTLANGEPDDHKGLAIRGQVYTVSCIFIDLDGTPSLWFAEIRPRGSDEMGFWPKCFRKVQKRTTETGMAIFKGILDGQPVRDFEREAS